MSDEEYFRSCIAKERRLAQLLGHEVEEYYESAGTLWENTEPLPQWTRDWSACGPLITEFELPIGYGKEAGEEHHSTVVVGPVIVHFSDHPSKERALMFAIVKAVIFLLEHGKADKSAHHHATQHTEEGIPHVSPRH
ncbi:MAG: aminoacyl-tRNA synthetase [Noviherbaspirillum sp.]